MITSGGEILMFYVTLTKLIFKCCFVEGGGGGGDVVGEGGRGRNALFQCIIFLLTMFLACKKVFCVADICIVYN